MYVKQPESPPMVVLPVTAPVEVRPQVPLPTVVIPVAVPVPVPVLVLTPIVK